MSLSIQSKSSFPPSTRRPLPPSISAKRRAVVRGSSSSQFAPRLPAALQVLHSRDFRNHIFSYLEFAEVALAGRITPLLGRSGTPSLMYRHKNRITLSKHDGEQLREAFKIQLSPTNNPWETILDRADNCFPNLRVLDLSYTHNSLISLFSLPATILPSVTTLDLSYVRLSNPVVVVDTLLSKLTSLENLILTKCEDIDKSTLLTIAKRGANWISLDLGESPAVNVLTLKALGANCLKLQKLNIGRCSLNQKKIRAISRGFPSLTHLDLHTHFPFVSANIELINLRQLKALNLSGCYLLNQKCIEALGRGCPALTHLNLSWCHRLDNEAASDIVFSQLTTLHLASSEAISSATFTSLGRQCPVLTSLDVSYSHQVDEIVLAAIARAFTLLHTLNLKDCPFVNKKGLRALTLRYGTLTSLNLSGKNQLKATCWKILLRLSSLTSLDLSSLESVDSKCLRILSRIPSLTSLNISDCNRIKETAFQAFAVSKPPLPNLTLLNVAYCKVTQEIMSSLVLNYPSLTSLDLSFCFPKGDKQIIPSLRAQFPTVKFIKDEDGIGHCI